MNLLDDYDHQRVAIGKVSSCKAKPVSYDETMKLIDAMRQKFGDSAVFGKKKDQSLHSSLNAVMQNFNGKDVYPSVEEKPNLFRCSGDKLKQTFNLIRLKIALQILHKIAPGQIAALMRIQGLQTGRNLNFTAGKIYFSSFGYSKVLGRLRIGMHTPQ